MRTTTALKNGLCESVVKRTARRVTTRARFSMRHPDNQSQRTHSRARLTNAARYRAPGLGGRSSPTPSVALYFLFSDSKRLRASCAWKARAQLKRLLEFSDGFHRILQLSVRSSQMVRVVASVGLFSTAKFTEPEADQRQPLLHVRPSSVSATVGSFGIRF